MKISVGAESFEQLRKSDSYFVDKSELIYDLVNANNTVTLFTRPRRFGKTLTMSMLESFFDCSRDSRGLFDGLDIMNHTEFCEEWMNRYPVIFITFKDVEGLDFDGAFDRLKAVISRLCIKISYIGENPATDEDDRIIFKKLKARQANKSEVQDSLFVLCRMMSTIFGKQVIVLIDEYDVPLAKAQENGYYREMLDVIRGMFSVALKTNDYLKFGVVTGCLRISKESIFTGVNLFTSYSVLDNRFSTYFGFTHDEVERMLREAGLEEKTDLVRSWYDGYVFGNTAVYCPWDVIRYVSDLQDDSNAQPQPYWKNTSGNGILKTFVERKKFRVSRQFETLMNGGTIRRTIQDQLTYDTMYKEENSLWSVLLMTGYLTKADLTAIGVTIDLKIPNREIATIFQDTVADHFMENLDQTEQRALIDALWAEDTQAASSRLTDFLWKTISYNNYHEDYYHAFLAGIFFGLGYEVESDKEHGEGRPDVLVIDTPNRRALIIEAEKADSEGRMEYYADDAIKQIVQRKYWKGLDGYKTILCYGVAFYKKNAFVKELKM